MAGARLMARSTTRSAPSAPSAPSRWGVPLALFVALSTAMACRSREGERCVCAEDCREGLLCVASGRVLAEGECSPAVGPEGSPGVCLPEDEAAEDDGGGGQAEPFMDMGSKLDFEPGPLPDDTSATGTSESGGATTEVGTTDATGTGSTGGTGSSTDATGTGSTTDATSTGTGSTGATSTGAT